MEEGVNYWPAEVNAVRAALIVNMFKFFDKLYKV